MTAVAVGNILSGDLTPLVDKLSQHPQADQLKRLLARSLFNKLFFPAKQPTRLDQRLTPALEILQQQFEEYCLVDLQFFSSGTHPLRQSFSALLKLGSTWYPRESKASEIYFEQISEVIEACISWLRSAQTKADEKSRNTKLQIALADFIHWVNSETKRAELLAERLCASELSHLTLIAAENYATQSINTAFSALSLPTDLSIRLNTHLKNCLQHAYLQVGSESNPAQESPFLKKWQQLFPLLRKIFVAHQAGDDQQTLYRDIPIVINELELSIPLAAGAQDTYAEFSSLVTHRLMQIVQQQPLEIFPFSPLVVSQEINFSQPNSFVQKNIDTLSVGHWFLVLGTQNEWIRCKLALLNHAASSLLFVDNSGRKVMLKSFADFSSLIALGDARPLTDLTIEKALTDTLTQLFTKIDSHSNESLESESTAMLQMKKSSAAKALAEAAALEKNLAQSSPAQTVSQTQMAESDLSNISTIENINAAENVTTTPPESELISLEVCQEKVSKLSLGAWVEFIQRDKPPQRLKLAVAIAASGKYIFVDELGRKQGDYLREQLVELMHLNQFKTISQGENFEDQLVKVIRGLRKDIS